MQGYRLVPCILASVLDRPRHVPLLWSAGFFAAFAVLAWMVAQQDRSPSTPSTTWGRDAEDWADDHEHLLTFLSLVEHAFSTIGMTVLTVLLAGALLYSKHRRAALFTVLVMVTTSLITTVVKLILARARPEWQDLVGLPGDQVVPLGPRLVGDRVRRRSSPCSPLMLVRRSSLRRWAYAGCVLLVVRHLGRPGAARAALPHRRDRRLAARHRGALVFIGVSTTRCRAATPQGASRCPRSSSASAGSR